jgi:hypothetical protein
MSSSFTSGAAEKKLDNVGQHPIDGGGDTILAPGTTEEVSGWPQPQTALFDPTFP